MKKFCALALAAAAALSMAAPASAGIEVRMLPQTLNVNVGDTFQIDLQISGLGDEILSAYDLNVLFNGGLAGYHDAVFSNALGPVSDPLFAPEATDNPGNTGLLGFSELLDDDLAAIQPDTVVFVSLSYTALSQGAAFFTWGADPDFQRNVVGRDALTLDASFFGTCVAIGDASCDNRVPAPATFGLAGLALLGAGLTSRRRRTQSPV
jgi:opacity protein-like surface antigen